MALWAGLTLKFLDIGEVFCFGSCVLGKGVLADRFGSAGCFLGCGAHGRGFWKGVKYIGIWVRLPIHYNLRRFGINYWFPHEHCMHTLHDMILSHHLREEKAYIVEKTMVFK
jgi:hypothetical protein